MFNLFKVTLPKQQREWIHSSKIQFKKILLSVPGIGEVAKKTLAEDGIHNTWELIGKFLSDFHRDPELFLNY